MNGDKLTAARLTVIALSLLALAWSVHDQTQRSGRYWYMPHHVGRIATIADCFVRNVARSTRGKQSRTAIPAAQRRSHAKYSKVDF